MATHTHTHPLSFSLHCSVIVFLGSVDEDDGDDNENKKETNMFRSGVRHLFSPQVLAHSLPRVESLGPSSHGFNEKVRL